MGPFLHCTAGVAHLPHKGWHAHCKFTQHMTTTACMPAAQYRSYSIAGLPSKILTAHRGTAHWTWLHSQCAAAACAATALRHNICILDVYDPQQQDLHTFQTVPAGSQLQKQLTPLSFSWHRLAARPQRTCARMQRYRRHADRTKQPDNTLPTDQRGRFHPLTLDGYVDQQQHASTNSRRADSAWRPSWLALPSWPARWPGLRRCYASLSTIRGKSILSCMGCISQQTVLLTGPAHGAVMLLQDLRKA